MVYLLRFSQILIKQLLDYQKKQISHTICLSMHTLKVNILESSVTNSIKFDHGRKIVFNILIAFIKTVINKKKCVVRNQL